MTISLSFGFILLLFLVIGLSSKTQAKANSEDYYLAGRTVSPLMVGLSAAASWCSGFIFLGQIGFTYTRGLSSIWIMLGLILGDMFIALTTFHRFRLQTGERKQQSYFEGLFDLSLEQKSNSESVLLWAVCGIALLALVGYSAAQILASGKAFDVVFSLPLEIGAFITVVVLAAYCFAGGVRASIWTDVAQALTMLAAMAILLWKSLQSLGGVRAFGTELSQLPAELSSLYPPDIVQQSPFFLLLVFLGWFGGGVGVGGQPHVMVRFMALNSSREMNKALGYYYGYYTILYTLAILIGLSARILVPELASGDSELALLVLAQKLLPDFLIGVILAGLLSSTMSTADSLVLSASSVVTRDLFPKLSESYVVTKIVTLLILAGSFGLVLVSASSVFSLVVVFGGMLSASFAPILLLRMRGFDLPLKVMASMAVVGFATTLVWRRLSYSNIMYQVTVGILVGLIIGSTYKLFQREAADQNSR